MHTAKPQVQTGTTDLGLREAQDRRWPIPLPAGRSVRAAPVGAQKRPETGFAKGFAWATDAMLAWLGAAPGHQTGAGRQKNGGAGDAGCSFGVDCMALGDVGLDVCDPHTSYAESQNRPASGRLTGLFGRFAAKSAASGR